MFVEDFGDLIQMGIDLVGQLSELIPGLAKFWRLVRSPKQIPRFPLDVIYNAVSVEAAMQADGNAPWPVRIKRARSVMIDNASACLSGSASMMVIWVMGCLPIWICGIATSLGLRHYRSISPNTMSNEPMIAETSASKWPRLRKSIACRCANEGARILHLYGWLEPSETR